MNAFCRARTAYACRKPTGLSLSYLACFRRVFVLSVTGIGYNVEAMGICGGLKQSLFPEMPE
jgi:hypothetical protein